MIKMASISDSVRVVTRWSLLTGFVLMTGLAHGQMQVTSGVFSPKDLIENVFLSNGVQVLEVKYQGDQAAIGYFSAAEINIGIPSGIVMSTGLAFNAGTNNTSNSTTGMTSGNLPDPNLEALVAPLQIRDLSSFEIRFIPYADTLEFRYVFASEEYEEYVCTNFNDVFGFFISGTGFNGPFANGAENIALVPGTSSYVAINSVNNGNPNMSQATCPPQNKQFFNLTPQNAQPTFDGYTDVFLARAIVVPCDTYTIRLSIADVSDQVFDSGVFLEAKSFGTPTIGFELETVSSNETIAEGCADGTGLFTIRAATTSDLLIPIQFTGTATPGVDFLMDPPAVVIPAGTRRSEVTFKVFSDAVMEGTESIGLIFQRNPCLLDTLWFFITDDTLPRPDLGPDLLICEGQPVSLQGELAIVLPSPKTFESKTPFPIPSPPNTVSPLTPVYSPLGVSGVYPKDLGPGMIEGVCVNIAHKWVDDVDIYLVAPSGRFIELSSDNGRDGDNYTETCFKPTATQPIDYGDPFGAPKSAAPFTGSFIPEGKWQQLWDASENPANGDWRLLVIDDAPLPDGELLDWRIVFNPEYQLRYAWSPAEAVGCDSCAQTFTVADTLKTLVLKVEDSYGCFRTDTLDVGVRALVDPPIADCAGLGYKDLEIGWNDMGPDVTYQVSVNGGAFQGVAPGELGFFLGGLGLLDSVTFVVKAVGPCNEAIDTIGCRTLDCIPPDVEVLQLDDPSCFGSSDGGFLIQVNASGVPYTLTMNGQVVPVGLQGGLKSGTYLIQALDTLACKDEVTVTLQDPPLLKIPSVLVDTVDCALAMNGALAPLVEGGTGPYQFLWQDGSLDSLRLGLSGGNYAITVTDAKGCQTSSSIPLFEYPPLLASIKPTDPTCAGKANGGIVLDIFGGAGGFQFTWGQPGLTGPSISDLAAGIYTVTVTDKNGCTLEQSVILTAPQNLVISILSDPTSCFGGSDGSITITVSGGTPPYDFLWSNGGPNTSQRNDLPAGNYSITVTDKGACQEVVTGTVAQPSGIEVNGTLSNVSCAGLSDGSIAVSASGGAGGYVFLWSNGKTGSTITGLSSGTYFLTTTDAANCQVVDTFLITAPSPINLIGVGKDVTCFGASTGTVTVSASGGNGGFQFLWNDPAQSTSATVSGLPAGTYSVTVTDSKGCSATTTVTITQPPAFTSAMFAGEISCFGAKDGTGTVTPVGGSAPFGYLWSDPLSQTSSTAVGLGSGTWYVTVTDKNNCSVVDTLELLEPTQLFVDVQTTEITCFGSNDGKVQAFPSGGTSPYGFTWTSGSKQATAQNLGPGTYTVTITDDRGCTVVRSASLTQPAEIQIAGTAVNVFCSGDKDGSIDLSVSGGVSPYAFLWNHGSTDEDPQGLGPGIYVVTVTDGNGCTKTFNIQVTSPQGMIGEFSKTDVACFGESTGAIDVQIQGGEPGYAYLWSDGSTAEDRTGLAPGSYSLTVTDGNGCTIERGIDIDQPDQPLAAVMIGDTLDCFGDRDGRIVFQVTGGTPAYRFSLDSLNFNGSNIQIGLPAGTYSGFVVDKLGCRASVGEVAVIEPAEVMVDLGPDFFLELGRDTQLNAIVTNGIPPLTYTWFAQDSAFLSCLACPDPKVVGLQFSRTFRVLVTDANGCTGEAFVTVNVDKTRVVLVPTAFSPEGDGNNDRLGVMGRPGTLIRNFRIYDRWGEQVFHAEEFLIEDGLLPANSWDGTFRGKAMGSAAFVWMLEAEYTDGEKAFYRGQSTLLR